MLREHGFTDEQARKQIEELRKSGIKIYGEEEDQKKQNKKTKN